MVVITMTDCPAKLRGDLSKWMLEINTGVYVGQMSSRVRDALWQRVCENLKDGRATMVFNTRGEQHMDFRVHHTTWTPVDYDGLKLIRRPVQGGTEESQVQWLPQGFSKAAKAQKIHYAQTAGRKSPEEFVVLDLETTGTSPEKDQVIEVGAVRTKEGAPTEKFSALLKVETAIPQEITALTGIDATMLAREGREPSAAVAELVKFLGKSRIVGYNVSFDLSFLRAACIRHGIEPPANRSTDILTLARQKLDDVANYRMLTVAEHFALGKQQHRAIPDCMLAWEIYLKLKEL